MMPMYRLSIIEIDFSPRINPVQAYFHCLHAVDSMEQEEAITEFANW